MPGGSSVLRSRSSPSHGTRLHAQVVDRGAHDLPSALRANAALYSPPNVPRLYGDALAHTKHASTYFGDLHGPAAHLAGELMS